MEQLLIFLPVLIFSIVLHEVAHGWVARQQGGNTAAMLGRLTLNPIPHIDPVGSLLVPAILTLLPGGLVFGWAKPVPINPRNFRNFKRGDILVCRMTNPAWVVLFSKIKGVVTDAGGVLSHTAVVAREFGLPAVVGSADATVRIKSGDRVRVNGNTGIVEILN